MIDREHARLIEINRSLQRLREAEAELAVFLANRVAINLDVLDRPRNIALAGPYPVSNHARAQHVGHQFVTLAIPHKQRWTRATTAIHLGKVLLLVASDIDFILQHARRPQHANDVGSFSIAEADYDIGGILSQVSVRSGNLKLLPVAASEHLHLGTDRAFVIGQSLE